MLRDRSRADRQLSLSAMSALTGQALLKDFLPLAVTARIATNWAISQVELVSPGHGVWLCLKLYCWLAALRDGRHLQKAEQGLAH